jgi:hypothetical protein
MQEMMVARAAAVEWFAKIAMPVLSTMRVATRLLSARAKKRRKSSERKNRRDSLIMICATGTRVARDVARDNKKAGDDAGLPSMLR